MPEELQEHRRVVFPPERDRAPGDQADTQRSRLRLLEERVQPVFPDRAQPAGAFQRRPRQELDIHHVGVGEARLQVQVQPVFPRLQNAGETAAAFAVPSDQGRDEVRVVRAQLQVAGGAPQARGERPLRTHRRRAGGLQDEPDEQPAATGGTAGTSPRQLDERDTEEGIAAERGRGVRRVRRNQGDDELEPRRQHAERRGQLGRQHRLQGPAVPGGLPEQSGHRGGQLQRPESEVQVPQVQGGVHQAKLLDGAQQDVVAQEGGEVELPHGKVLGPEPPVQVRRVQGELHAEEHLARTLQLGESLAQVEEGDARTAEQQQQPAHVARGRAAAQLVADAEEHVVGRGRQEEVQVQHMQGGVHSGKHFGHPHAQRAAPDPRQ